ncbi:MAG TPA: MXAN_5187 C-terminal domain-containing protein [Vicinamibacteria bacterium]
MGFEEDLADIEGSIRRLGVEWDKFFAGVEKKPPNELKTKVDALVRRHANLEIKNATDRFRYQGLTAKYNTLSELWAKRLRAREEGKVFGMHGLKAEALPPPPPPPPPANAGRAARRGDTGEVRVGHPERDGAAVKALYDKFLAARTEAGEQAPVKFESFQKLISQQASRILAEKGGQAVDFRLETKDGKVSLKAKVVK